MAPSWQILVDSRNEGCDGGVEASVGALMARGMGGGDGVGHRGAIGAPGARLQGQVLGRREVLRGHPGGDMSRWGWGNVSTYIVALRVMSGDDVGGEMIRLFLVRHLRIRKKQKHWGGKHDDENDDD